MACCPGGSFKLVITGKPELGPSDGYFIVSYIQVFCTDLAVQYMVGRYIFYSMLDFPGLVHVLLISAIESTYIYIYDKVSAIVMISVSQR